MNYFPYSTPQIKDPAPEELTLLQGLRENEPLFFRLLYKRYTKSLLSIISRIVKNDEEAEDVLQETFIRISQNIHSYDADKSRLFTWMARIAKNKSLDHLRRKARTTGLGNLNTDNLQVDTIGNLHTLGLNIDTIGIKVLTQGLPESQKQVVDLLYFGGYTQNEVAQELNMPLGTIKTKNRMAMITLRALFETSHRNAVNC